MFPLSPAASRHIPLWKRLLLVLAVLGAGAAYHRWRRGEEPPPPPQMQRPVPRSTMIVLFQTEPPGALVSLDGRTLGISPLTLESVTVGEHEVKATLEGREETIQAVTIWPEGEHARVMIVLPEAREEPAPQDERD